MDLLDKISDTVTPEKGIEHELALRMAELDSADTPLLFAITRRLRAAASGNKVYLCSIVNAKSGRCSEDCRFCAQSARYQTEAEDYPLLDADRMLEAAKEAKRNRAGEFSLVTSGKGIKDPDEVEVMERAVSGTRALGLHSCVSPGIVARDVLEQWKAAGLDRYHHNLETAPSFFKEVCTTHDIEEDIEAVKTAKEVGLEVCCGGIFGLGESWAQRVELAMLLRDLGVDSVPLNFLNPIPGTPMAETAPGITPMEALKTIALFRLAMPKVRVVLCGGREVNLRDLQAFMFEAGANAILIGNYLTTTGRPAEDDLRMIGDLGLEPAPP
jgi:biotin synthase